MSVFFDYENVLKAGFGLLCHVSKVTDISNINFFDCVTGTKECMNHVLIYRGTINHCEDPEGLAGR